MTYHSASVSHQGKVRTRNEDSFHADDQAGIWLVADGMGGHAGGDVASRLAVETVRESLGQGSDLEAAIEQAHQAILRKAKAEPDLAGMGTTIVAARVSKRKLELAWVGDSRIYLLEAGRLTQLSVDHSFVQDMVLRGVLTEEEASRHPKKNLVRQALGQAGLQRLQVDTLEIKLKTGQELLLCTDGVHDMLSSQQIATALAATGPEEQIASLEETVLNSQASDNFTAIVIERQQHPVNSWISTLLPNVANRRLE